MHAPPGTFGPLGGSKKYSLTDLKLIKRHDTLNEIPGYELCLLKCRALSRGIDAEALDA
jgi:hypothetical protein